MSLKIRPPFITKKKTYKSEPTETLTPFITKKIRGYVDDIDLLTRLSRKHLKTDKCREFNFYPNNKWCKKKRKSYHW